MKGKIMFESLRFLKAKDWQGGSVDMAAGVMHDVFHTPFSSAIGNSFVAMVAACMIVMIVAATDTSFGYIDFITK